MTNAPTRTSSLSIGTAMSDRAPPYLAAAPGIGSDSSSAVGTGFFAIRTRSSGLPYNGWSRAALFQEIGKSGRHTMHRPRMEKFSIVPPQHAKLGVADARRICQHSIETRL